MSEREPAVLMDEPSGTPPDAKTTPFIKGEPKAAAKADPTPTPVRPSAPAMQRSVGRREASSVYVVGFWKRFAAAFVDLMVVLPVALLITFIASKVVGIHLPAKNLKLTDIDMWIDLVLATNPAIVMGIVLFLAIGMVYLFVFHMTLGRTLGMRLLKMKVIDVYGDPPSPARCAARCAGYLASLATLFLGFLWIGFDSEKRGLQDWIAGTYVIRA
ncbi:MAG TPA: RDD family protein [Kofleriaceae bacterium]|nr:RDD family protein [Kofleriaceae bacterium]